MKKIIFEQISPLIWTSRTNKIGNLPLFLRPLFETDEYNPIAAFVGNIEADKKSKIRIIITVEEVNK